MGVAGEQVDGTAVATPATVRSAPVSGRRRPRWTSVAAVLVPAVAGLVVVGVLWARHYQPLGAGSGWYGAGRVSEGDQFMLRPDREITNVMGTEYVVTEPKPGDRVGLVVPITNTGRYPIRIVAVQAPFTRYHVTGAQAFRSRDLWTGGAPFVSLRPFTLGPGKTRGIAVAARVTCRSGHRQALSPQKGSASVTATSVRVTYRFVGFTTATRIPLDYPLTLQNPPQCAS